MRYGTVVVSALALLGASGFATGVLAHGKGQPLACSELVSLQLPDTTILSAEVVGAGTFVPAGSTQAIDTAACRVVGSIKPTSDSDILFEVWMPTAGWNGKFLSSGEGGFAGAINYLAVGGIADALRRGYAGGSTDTGHVGGTADFAVGHPEKVIDYAYRGKHLQALRTKDIIRAFYGKPAQHSYFSSCSNGGRQALMEIQRFPEDYDGVIVGAPANAWTRLLTGFIWNEQELAEPGAALSQSKLDAIQAATLATCDGLDGVGDGVVEDPRRCSFKPETLACAPGADGPGCLTPPQVQAVKAIMQGPRNPRTGELIYPGYFTSAAAEAAAWPTWITGPVQAFFGNGYFGRFVEEVPLGQEWDFTTFDFDADFTFAEQKNGNQLSAVETNLRPFKRANPRGRIIMWHGWEDPAITSRGAVAYHDAVLRDTPGAESFFRLFMVPGMLHCGGGPGPNAFGQGYAGAPAFANTPEFDVVSALERWVEHGEPPKRIVAVKYVNDDPAQGVARSRPLCPYPQVAVYKGSGSTDEAANFRCVAPKRGDFRGPHD